MGNTYPTETKPGSRHGSGAEMNNMMDMNNMMGGGWLAMLLGFLLILVVMAAVVIAAVYFVRRAGDGGGERSRSGREGGLEVLRERFARGEIDPDEFEERRRALRV